MAEISSEGDFRAWLKGKPREVAAVLAARAALRILPLWRVFLREIDAERRDAILLPIFGASAAALVSGTGPTKATEVRDAASTADVVATAAAVHAAVRAPAAAHAAAGVRAAGSARAARASAAFAASAAARAAADVYAAARDEVWAALSADCAFLDAAWKGDIPARAEALADWPLWPSARWGEAKWGEGKWAGGTPDWASENWQSLRRSLNAVNDEHWVVWTRWYQDRLDGKPYDKALEEARVLIPEDLWNDGPAAVNAELQHVIDRHRPPPLRGLKRKIRQLERVGLNPQTQALRFEPMPESRAEWYEAACQSVVDRVERLKPLLDGRLGNFPELRDIVGDLDFVLSRYPDRPQRLHSAFGDALALLGPILAQTAEHHVQALARELERGILDIRGHRPEVEKIARLRAEARIILEPEPVGALRAFADAARQITEGTLRTEMEDDTATVTEAAEAGPVAAEGDAKDAAYRDGAKAISIREAAGRVLDGAERGADLTVKFGRAVDTIEKLWPTLAAWMSRWFY